MAAVYFAGHGMEINGENWLIPVDAELKRDTDAANEAISLQSVMLQVADTTSLGLVILDACRNNPFAAKMNRALVTRAAVSGGLGRIEPVGNVLVAYAARDGTTALDGDGHNSSFTEKYIAVPDKRELDLGKPRVLDFAREFLPDDFDEVRYMFGKPGAYQKFKTLLVRRHALDQWYDFEKKGTERALRQWC